VLNPTLYEALKAAYKSVDIYNEDEALTLSRLPTRSTLMGRENDKVTSDMVDEGGEYYAVDCPFCKDTRHRLWVCHAWGSKIEVNGQLLQVSKGVAHCYNEHCLDSHTNWLDFCKSVEGTWKPQLITTGSEFERLTGDKETVVEMPPYNYYVDDPQGSSAVVEYLVDRGYNMHELRTQWDFRAGKIDFYDVDCVIMPVVCQGKYKFWQARYPFKGKVPEHFRDGRRKPKYYIPAGAKKSRVLYNFDRATQTPIVVLVEGIFDAVRVGMSGVAMFGKKPSTRQQMLLVNHAYDKTVVWIPDMDDPEALEYARSYTGKWNSAKMFAGGAHVVTLPDGDPAEYTRKNLCNLIMKSISTK